MELTGRSIAITGGTSGIGLGLVQELAARGNTVITCGRSGQRLSSLRAALPEVRAVEADLATPEGIEGFLSQIEEACDVLDVLINNAGVTVGFDRDDPEATAAASAELISINVTAPVTLSIRCLPLLEESPAPAIVNVSSIVGHVPKGRAPVYSASKAAVRAFTVALRSALADSPVRVFDVLPPLVASRMPGPPGMKRMEARRFARIVTRAIEKDRLDVRTGRNRWIVQLARVSPKLADRLIG